MLSRIPARRVCLAASCLLGVAGLTLALDGSPAAAAAPVASAAATGIPASASNQLGTEMTAAWQISTGQGVTVAVLDTAVDQVGDLAGKLTIGPDYAPLPGADATDGTVIASLIAGTGPTTSNAFGAVGRAPGARILALQVWNPYNQGSQEQHYESNGVWQGIVAQAIRYAVDHGAGVVVTAESGRNSSALQSAVAYAISKNVVVIGSSGGYTGAQQDLAYPDSLPGVINFSGTTISGQPAPPNSQLYAVNDSILLTAPDNELSATGPGNQPYYGYDWNSAVAWVAGTVALIKSVYPQITPGQVSRALALSASYPPAGGYDPSIGFGMINPLGALHEAAALVKLGATAAPGPNALAAGAHLGGKSPGIIRAVRHPLGKLVGYSAAIVIGFAVLALAAAVRRRPRRAPRHVPRGPGPPAGPPVDPRLDPPLDPVG